MKTQNAGYWLAMAGKILITAAVVAFLGLHSVNFFSFAFPSDQSYYAWLGFALTGGGVFVYMLMLKYGQLTEMQKSVSLVMLIVSVVGELAAAGFGMQIEVWAKSGWQMTEDDFQIMLLVTQALGLAHALALIIMTVGDDVVAMFEKKVDPSVSSSPVSSPAEVGGASFFKKP